MNKHDKRRIFLTVSIIHVPSFTSSDTLNADVSMKSIYEDKKRRKKKGNKQRKKESERYAKRKMLNMRIGEKGRHVDMNVQTTRLPETTKRKRSVKREIPAFESRQDEARPYFLIVQSNRIPIELDEKMKGR